MCDNNSCKECHENKKCHKKEKKHKKEKCCIPGPTGTQGSTGAQGQIGPTGTQGPSGFSSYADFYALMPGDNSSTVVVGDSVQFPQNGPTSASGITRLTASTFNLANIGTYNIRFQVSVTEAGQLVVVANALEIAATVVGRATGTSQIIGDCLFTTTSINTIISINNPASNSTALTITPSAGGASNVSAHLVILQLA